MVQIVLLNGGSSSGKSTLARSLQTLLPTPWLTLGVDTVINAMPLAMLGSSAGIKITADGMITISPEVQRLDTAWMHGMAAIAHAGAGIILDQVFVAGGVAAERWKTALAGLSVLWVGVKCDPDVAAEREAARGDRVHGMAKHQADLVHQGMTYDIEVDTTHQTPEACARIILDAVAMRPDLG